MGIRERHALRSQPIQIRRRDFAPRRVQTMHVAITKIVSKNKNDVGLVGSEKRD